MVSLAEANEVGVLASVGSLPSGDRVFDLEWDPAAWADFVGKL